uniref:Leukotriene C4 synthase n=1 Tax=Monopterus albus TaxID=43700 RepID=A0A3Q3Q2U3_MONAL
MKKPNPRGFGNLERTLLSAFTLDPVQLEGVLGLSSLCGLLYLYARFRYFHGYSQSAQERLAPLYFSAQVLWVLIGFSCLGVFLSFCRIACASTGRLRVLETSCLRRLVSGTGPGTPCTRASA